MTNSTRLCRLTQSQPSRKESPIDAIGLVVGIVIGIPVFLAILTIAITALALQVGIVLAILGYLAGIPYAIWFRLAKGRWPQY